MCTFCVDLGFIFFFSRLIIEVSLFKNNSNEKGFRQCKGTQSCVEQDEKFNKLPLIGSQRKRGCYVRSIGIRYREMVQR